ncbi:MAG TPA: hypothetical protein VLG27_01300 [Candidatus Saccharimonadia bacterium]|nr:hypothetical protein [Candidatus Saccharimonadia bacterium]
MEHKEEAPPKAEPRTPVLPVLISSPAEITRLASELDQIDEVLMQLSMRTAGTDVKMPKTSRLMDMLVEHNKLNLLKPEDRVALKQFLVLVKDKAPRLHVSFGADPAPAFMDKLMTWLRKEISPYVLVTVGLQPNIGAGCIVRSTNKQFDFSLGKTFINKRELLMQKLTIAQAA